MNKADYKGIWNGLAEDISSAKIHVGGTVDEGELSTATLHTLNVLRGTIGIKPEDECLEIGCGVGRVGRGLAPLVRRWVGCDASSHMVKHARARLADLRNVELVETSGFDLKPLPDASFDVVYCTVVFMHIDVFERYNYIKEAWRVLRPGGRFFCDNTNLMTDDGWAIFEQLRTTYSPLERPAHISRCSTPQELETYLTRAQFRDVHSRTRHLWVDAWGTK
ncbi:MAG: type 11 methyltransferase [Verrucomicrobia bacterium]|nr:type 11 methyltransferase [Verrucomicrobiota bacterium]